MHIQLTDFGSSFIIDENEPSKETTNDDKKLQTRRNSFVGTAQFVAPEILQHGPIDYALENKISKSRNINSRIFRSDLWSLGCIIYQMHTGKHLFRGQ